MSQLEIDVWSDIACPWCWIGKRNLEEATRQAGLEVVIHWHAFELDPGAPREVAETVDYSQRLARKYGTAKAEAQVMIDRMTEAGRARGVDMRFDRIRPSNTFDAHRLLAWAAEVGAEAQSRLKERLFAAYLGEGRVMADPETLAELAADTGLDRDAATAVLRSERYSDTVRRDEQTAADQGIRGVPSFVLARRYLLTGAQPPEVIAQALTQAAGEKDQIGSDDRL